jgi:hypothetical protein
VARFSVLIIFQINHPRPTGSIEKELVKEGEKLSDILSMPIKDALGRDIDVDYSEDIANLREVLDAAKTRFKIFSDSLDVQKLTLEQITNIHSCEKDAETAIKWVESELCAHPKGCALPKFDSSFRSLLSHAQVAHSCRLQCF